MNQKLLRTILVATVVLTAGYYWYANYYNNDDDSNSDLIHVFSPKVNEVVKSPLVITGEARGNWYFEASFPVRLLDANGNELAITPAQAKGDWMTTNFVPFEATLIFPQPTTATGVLVLEKDNPSGLPENDAEVRIPIKFNLLDERLAVCKPTGCSGQICSDEEMMSTCEYKEEYSCYKNARCERQANGRCGWTQTEELRICLEISFPQPVID